MELNTRLTNLFKNLFPDFEDAMIQKIFESGKQIRLDTGEFLFHQGDEDKNMYIVLSGRLRAIEDKDGSKKALGDIGAGESVGEMAFFSEDNRMASIRAIRDSLVLQFNPEQYMDFISSDPKIASSLIKQLANRFKQNAFYRNKSTAPKNIAFLKLQESIDLKEFQKGMHTHLQKLGNPVQFFENNSVDKADQQSIFDHLEDWEGCNILFCDANDKEWAKQCIIYADLIVVATNFDAEAEIREIEEYLDLYSEDILHKNLYLLLFHESTNSLPQNTSRWLRERNVDLHIHIRKNFQKDCQRFCRIISHQANGLILGGGGAKGFAHIGAVQALLEYGIDIDFLGGTSAGALYGIGMAFADFDMQRIRELNAEGIKRKLTSGDFTLPIISLMTGRKFKRYLIEMFQDTQLEDIWINTFCVSSNISKAKIHIHKNGAIWKQIKASMAIPGVFPPVIIDKNLHVDGGVMNNVPIEPIYEYPIDKIFAIALSNFHYKDVELEEVPSSWKILLGKLKRKKEYSLPGITTLLTNSLVVNSYQKQEIMKNKVSDFLELDLKGVKMLDDKNWEEILQKGYDQTKAYLEANGYKPGYN